MPAAEPAEQAAAEPPPAERAEAPQPQAPPEAGELPEPSAPEPTFVARMPPPMPERPLPSTRRAIFFDVENTSRAEHIARVLAHLGLDRVGRATELLAVGNWRVIGHDTARLLARHGAHLVHSAPSVGVRDWSDLRIAVAAGVWLAAARPGDAVEIVSDDQAFDAVGDVAASLGVAFQRLSYRGLAGITGAEPANEEPTGESRSRRRRRGGRRGRREGTAAVRRPEVAAPSPPANGGQPEVEPHTAPHDEIVSVVRALLGTSPGRGVSIDALSNALKARGFRRPPGSPRLITRLRRIKELAVSRSGMITLVEAGPAEEVRESAADREYTASNAEATPVAVGGEPPAEAVEGAAAPARTRRRRRRGGRRRRGRGSHPAAVAAP